MSRFRPDFNSANISPSGSMALPRPVGSTGFKPLKQAAAAIAQPLAEVQERIAQFNRDYPVRVGVLLSIFGVYLAFLLAAIGEVISSLAGGAYIPSVGVLAIVVSLGFLTARHLFQFARTPLVFPWILFAVWIVLSTSVSLSRTESASAMWPFLLRTFFVPWFICAIALRANHVRYLIYCGAAAQCVILLACMIGGATAEGRFYVPFTPSYANPNDLALDLLTNGSFMLLLLYRGKIFRRSLCFFASAAAIYFVFRTGSRSNFLTLLLVVAVVFLFAPLKARLTALIFGPILAAAVLAFVPASTWTRLTFVFLNPEDVTTTDPNLRGALGSQIARTELQTRALQLAARSPLFGVGPAMYTNAVERLMQYELRLGKSSWQSTHNAYLEVAAEMGIPAFVFYTWIMLGTLVMAVKTMRRCTREPALRDYFSQSLCLAIAATVYSIGLLFSNYTYYPHMAIILGLTTANAMALEREAQLSRELQASTAKQLA